MEVEMNKLIVWDLIAFFSRQDILFHAAALVAWRYLLPVSSSTLNMWCLHIMLPSNNQQDIGGNMIHKENNSDTNMQNE